MARDDTPNEGADVTESNREAGATHLRLNFVEVLHWEECDSTERERRDGPDGNRERYQNRVCFRRTQKPSRRTSAHN